MKEQIQSEKKSFARHYEESALINARAEDIFAYVDDPSHLSYHMMQSSWMMGGGRMDTSVDDGHGQKVGSHIRMSGKAFGITLFLDEIITQYKPPRLKTWETVGEIRLLVIGNYRMGVDTGPQNGSSLLRVFIDYDLPATNAWLGRLFGKMYAKWCVNQMIKGVREHFDEELYVCEACGLHFAEESWAEKCASWDKKHGTCNREIAAHSIESQKSKINKIKSS